MGYITKRGVVHQFPEGWGFYSWSPSVVWNDELGVFIMATGGTQRSGTGDPISTRPHNESGSLMLLYAEKPWGPWKQFYYNINWKVGEDLNRTYLSQLASKWISDEGKSMYIIFSDAARKPNNYYKLNMIKVKIEMSK